MPDRRAANSDMGRRAIFFDRDGTLNVEKDLVYRLEDWEWVPGAVDAIRTANSIGFEVIVVTSQAGIARGLYTEQDLYRLHARVDADLAKHGARIDAYYFCPHHSQLSGPCDCRNPAPGLLLRAAQECGIALIRSFLVGDKASDIEATVAAGCAPNTCRIRIRGQGTRKTGSRHGLYS